MAFGQVALTLVAISKLQQVLLVYLDLTIYLGLYGEMSRVSHFVIFSEEYGQSMETKLPYYVLNLKVMY